MPPASAKAGARATSPRRGSTAAKPCTVESSKMANLLFAKELARRFSPGGRAANAVHPGVILTI
jgi:NAD(P)-dependent dehydrogenase (short-subunit alcohol dehydrogenase family)